MVIETRMVVPSRDRLLLFKVLQRKITNDNVCESSGAAMIHCLRHSNHTALGCSLTMSCTSRARVPGSCQCKRLGEREAKDADSV